MKNGRYLGLMPRMRDGDLYLGFPGKVLALVITLVLRAAASVSDLVERRK